MGFATEDFLLRFPTIGEEIFDQLDNENLVNCKGISRVWRSIVDESKIVWRRKIQRFNENHVEFHQHWKSVLKNIPRDKIKELALAVEQFYTMVRAIRRLDFNHSPLHITAERGLFSLHKFLTEKILAGAPRPGILSKVANFETIQSKAYGSNEINPERKNGMTPFHFAASYGHYDICKFIIEKINVKNPRDSTDGTTPLHMAAGNGHTNVCRLIIDLVVDKNPRNDYGSTPLHWAAEDGHLEAYKLIFEKVEEKNPSNKNEQTPLGLAGNNGRFQILKYAGNELAN